VFSKTVVSLIIIHVYRRSHYHILFNWSSLPRGKLLNSTLPLRPCFLEKGGLNRSLTMVKLRVKLFLIVESYFSRDTVAAASTFP
jgi:hypothetical protein